jgi:hypothetical protein
MKLIPESWLKNAIKNASQIITLCLELKNCVGFPAGDSCKLLLIIEAISASASSTPISSNVSFALTRSFF